MKKIIIKEREMFYQQVLGHRMTVHYNFKRISRITHKKTKIDTLDIITKISLIAYLITVLVTRQ